MGNFFYQSPIKSLEAVVDVVRKINEKKICSCIVGISKINKKIIFNLSHSAILLLPYNIEEYDDNELGLLLEYGAYCWPDINTQEMYNVKNNLVVYRYKEKGGLRYYLMKIREFKKKFDLCFIEMNIRSDNKITFDYFINTISPLKENKWIEKKYSYISFNNIDFVNEALKILKPIFNLENINVVNDEKEKTKNIPQKILVTLNKFRVN